MPVMVRGDSHLETPRGRLKRAGKAVVYPAALRVFDAALYVGEWSRRYWEHYGYPAHRLVFSPHCVDNAWFAARATEEAGARLRAAHGIEPNGKVVLFAGKLVPFKRVTDAALAAGILSGQQRPVTLMIAGSGPLADELTTVAGAAGVRLLHLGFCNQTAMPQAYAAANALVLPSSAHETWGLVANEALACGTPIIVSDACGCAADLAADGAVGRIVPVGNIDALAAAMLDILDHPPAREVIAGRIARYSPTAAAEGIIEATARVASRSAA
jgi:glycosyltransferase involved in cell wall biosynthesis